jgi:hypothetical protein
VTQRLGWTLDPDDPRAPPSEVWHALTSEERAALQASLPSEWEDTAPPEGDPHWNPKVSARKTLQRYFSRIGRSVYVGSELPIYYPSERVFAPDVMAVLDVPLHERDRWVVDAEGKGLDWVLEIFVSGSRKKDHVANVERYARLGIADYFLFDRGRGRLHGWHLPSPEHRTYAPILPQGGRYAARTLGLEMGVVGEKLRFFKGDAELPEVEELIERLERFVDGLERRAEEEAKRAEEEAKLRADVEDQLAAALAEIARLKGD